jgi:hypothetical protein
MTPEEAEIEIARLVEASKGTAKNYKDDWRYRYAVLVAECGGCRWYSRKWLVGLAFIVILVPLLNIINTITGSRAS